MKSVPTPVSGPSPSSVTTKEAPADIKPESLSRKIRFDRHQRSALALALRMIDCTPLRR
jgi:hypothetical protein